MVFKRIRIRDTNKINRLRIIMFLGVSLRAIDDLKSCILLLAPFAWSAAVLALEI